MADKTKKLYKLMDDGRIEEVQGGELTLTKNGPLKLVANIDSGNWLILTQVIS